MDFDEKKIETIISNILSHAIKFSKEKGEIQLRLQEDNDRLLLRVKDNGIGIPPDKLPHIFERFYQAEGSQDVRNTHRQTGSGIGLTLTKELVELMGGEITATSKLGEGTEFTISLPISRQAPVVNSASLAQMTIPSTQIERQSMLDPSNGDPLPLLLLIEDNTDIASYIMTILEGRYLVEWARNGASGITKAVEIIPDAIITDVMMPEKDGFEVCQTLKNDEHTSHIPIIMLTAKIDVASKLEGLGVGADAYLAKPFLKEELFIRLEKMVELRRKLQERYAGKSDFLNSDKQESPASEPSLDELFLQKIRDLVEANLNNAEFGNAQLASQMFMSESQLFRKLKALTGNSIAIHIRSIRLQKGKELLLNTNLTITAIAYETGFSDLAYFSRTFSQEFGITPSDVRK
jgi:DNA-binding response OmpR family regulator